MQGVDAESAGSATEPPCGTASYGMRPGRRRCIVRRKHAGNMNPGNAASVSGSFVANFLRASICNSAEAMSKPAVAACIFQP